MLAALAILLILLGALGSALIAFRSGDRIDVVAVQREIPFGETIEPGDLMPVRAAEDTPGVLSYEVAEQIVGMRATTRIPAESLLSRGMFTDAPAVPDNGALVGIQLDGARRPSYLPSPGQKVRLFFVAGDTSTAGDPGEMLVSSALVMSTSGGGSDTATVTVLVQGASKDLGRLLNYAASGNVGMAILPDTAAPDLDAAK